jgi:hypothetical protein
MYYSRNIQEAAEQASRKSATIKVFSMNDCDWMAGETLEACKAEYIKNYGGDAWEDENEDQFADARELTPWDMQHYKFTDDNGGERTFQEQLEKMISDGDEFPAFFASTEC